MSQSGTDPDLHQVTQTLFGSLALLLALAGQFWLYSSPQGLWPGVGLTALAMVVFVGSRVMRVPPWAQTIVTRLRLSYRGVLIGLALVLSIMTTVTDVSWQQINRTNYAPVLMLWAGSALAYLAAFWGQLPSFDGRSWWRTHRSELIALAVVVVLGAALRFYRLGEIPRVIDGDEGRVGQFALNTRLNPLASPFTLAENFGALYLQAIGLALFAFDRTLFALRLMPAVGGTLAILATFALGRQLFSSRVGWVAAALVAVAHTHLHFSRSVAVAYIQETWLIPLELYFFISGLTRRSRWRLALGGLILGLHFNVYVSAQIITALIPVYLLIAWIVCRPWLAGRASLVLVFIGGLVVAALPHWAYAFRNPDQFFARLNVDGTFQSGWLAAQVVETGKTAVQILAERVAHTFLSLNYYPAGDFYGARIPVLDLATATLFILGLGYAVWRTRSPEYLLLNGYFWAITVAIGVFSLPPTADSYRMLAVIPAAALLAAIGLEQILLMAQADQPAHKAVRAGLLSFVLVAVFALNFRAYFWDFASQCRHGGEQYTRFASYFGNYLRTVNRHATVYLLSNDVFYYGIHSSIDFLSGARPVNNWPDPLTALAPLPQTVVVAIPSRVTELQEWAANYPGGQFREQYDCENLMLVAYELP